MGREARDQSRDLLCCSVLWRGGGGGRTISASIALISCSSSTDRCLEWWASSSACFSTSWKAASASFRLSSSYFGSGIAARALPHAQEGTAHPAAATSQARSAGRTVSQGSAAGPQNGKRGHGMTSTARPEISAQSCGCTQLSCPPTLPNRHTLQEAAPMRHFGTGSPASASGPLGERNDDSSVVTVQEGGRAQGGGGGHYCRLSRIPTPAAGPASSSSRPSRWAPAPTGTGTSGSRVAEQLGPPGGRGGGEGGRRPRCGLHHLRDRSMREAPQLTAPVLQRAL